MNGVSYVYDHVRGVKRNPDRPNFNGICAGRDRHGRQRATHCTDRKCDPRSSDYLIPHGPNLLHYRVKQNTPNPERSPPT